MSFDRIFGVGATSLVVLGAVLAFQAIGSPGHARALQFDERRSMQVRSLAWSISERYGGERKTLPATLPPDPEAIGVPNVVARDPETNAPYGYERTGPQTFRLCATFALAASEKDNQIEDTHPAGRTCFRYDAHAMGAR